MNTRIETKIALPFDEKMTFITKLEFTQHWKYRPKKSFVKKVLKATTMVQIGRKCNCNVEFMLNRKKRQAFLVLFQINHEDFNYLANRKQAFERNIEVFFEYHKQFLLRKRQEYPI